MNLSKRQIEMYNECTFLNEGLLRKLDEKKTAKNRLKQFENLNSLFDNKFEQMDKKMTDDGYHLVKNLNDIRDDYNRRKIRDHLRVTKIYNDGFVSIYTPSLKMYKGSHCISTVYSDGITNPTPDECSLNAVKFVYVKTDKDGTEKMKVKNVFGIIAPTKKYFTSK